MGFVHIAKGYFTEKHIEVLATEALSGALQGLKDSFGGTVGEVETFAVAVGS
jgi:hypothetical protein